MTHPDFSIIMHHQNLKKGLDQLIMYDKFNHCGSMIQPPPPPPPRPHPYHPIPPHHHPDVPYTKNPHDTCGGCCSHMNHPPMSPDRYPSSGKMQENAFMLVGGSPFIYDNTNVQYGPRLCVSENVFTRVSQRRDPSCINLAATFDMTDDIITNTVLNHYLEQIIGNNVTELQGVLPIIYANTKFTLHYTVYDMNGGVVHESSKSVTSQEMKYHSTDIKDYYLNSCRNIFTINIPAMDFQGMYTLTLNSITASVNVLNTIEHISENLNPYYQFMDNNTHIAVQHETIMTHNNYDGEMMLASCDINHSVMFQSNITTRMKLSFTAYMSNIISTQNTFNVWSILCEQPVDEQLIIQLKEQVDELTTMVNTLTNNMEVMSSDIDKLTSIVQKMLNSDLYDKSQIDNLMANKVDKIDGMGLSSNDYTDEDKLLLHTLSTSGQIVFGTHLEFPNIGVEDILYVAKDEYRSYIWDSESLTYKCLNTSNVITDDIDAIQSVLTTTNN